MLKENPKYFKELISKNINLLKKSVKNTEIIFLFR